MKTTYKYLLLAGLVVLAASCEKEIEKESPADATTGKMITETISAQIEGATKATVDADAKFAWTVGDNIAVHVSNEDGHAYVTTSSGASVADASASFTVSYPELFNRDAFAIFPSTIVETSAANYGQSGSALDVTLPSTYTLEQVSGTATPCPMIATNTPGAGWTFSQLCGVLRLTVNSIPSDATGIVIQFPGKKVNGNFSIASPVTPGSSTIATGVPASGGDQITVTFDAGTTSATINLPLPTGDYDDVFITPVGSDTKVAAVRHIKAGGYTVQAAHGKKLTTTLVSFSVAGDKKVVFAPGNLQYQAGSNTWRFAEHQYDFVGDNTYGNVYVNEFKSSNALMSESYTGWIDMFGWGTSGWPNSGEGSSGVASWINYQPWASEDRVDHSATYPNNKWGYGPDNSDATTLGITGKYNNGDWGVFNAIGAYSEDTWRTPSQAEMLYAIGSTSAGVAGHSTVGYATVSGVSGIIILPDSFTDPMKNGGSGAFINSETKEYLTNNYSASDWEYMESAGAVFLPGSGVRKAFVMSDISTPNIMIGYYWLNKASDELPEKGCCIRFGHSYFYSDYAINRCYGAAVRLIRELN